MVLFMHLPIFKAFIDPLFDFNLSFLALFFQLFYLLMPFYISLGPQIFSSVYSTHVTSENIVCFRNGYFFVMDITLNLPADRFLERLPYFIGKEVIPDNLVWHKDIEVLLEFLK